MRNSVTLNFFVVMRLILRKYILLNQERVRVTYHNAKMEWLFYSKVTSSQKRKFSFGVHVVYASKTICDGFHLTPVIQSRAK